MLSTHGQAPRSPYYPNTPVTTTDIFAVGNDEHIGLYPFGYCSCRNDRYICSYINGFDCFLLPILSLVGHIKRPELPVISDVQKRWKLTKWWPTLTDTGFGFRPEYSPLNCLAAVAAVADWHRIAHCPHEMFRTKPSPIHYDISTAVKNLILVQLAKTIHFHHHTARIRSPLPHAPSAGTTAGDETAASSCRREPPTQHQVGKRLQLCLSDMHVDFEQQWRRGLLCRCPTTANSGPT